MKLILASLVFTEIALAQNFQWRLYISETNSTCNHNTTPGFVFPPFPAPPATNDLGECVNAPEGLAWTRLEILASRPWSSNTKLVAPPPGLDVFLWCDPNCNRTGIVGEQLEVPCSAGPSSCPVLPNLIGSFIAYVLLVLL
ncbi:hypothetical protein B0H13DRAFT_1863434 [Mycena leptocephala]|nr:hypothetical protein B0H13DRAFT_1863434 [Mycena leptocephala]